MYKSYMYVYIYIYYIYMYYVLIWDPLFALYICKDSYRPAHPNSHVLGGGVGSCLVSCHYTP